MVLFFADITEGIAEPGIKAVTTNVNNDDFTTANGFSASNVENCLMANSDAQFLCDAPAGSGKRVKTSLTGASGFDLRFLTGDTSGITEYFTYGKMTNLSGARLMGFSMQLGTGTGDAFTVVDSNTSVLFDELTALGATAPAWPGLGGEVTGHNPLQRTYFPDGLFGDGGQEGTTGFFAPTSAGFVFIQSADGITIDATTIFGGAAYTDSFGDGMLDRSQIPDGYFFDDDGDIETEGVLKAWYDYRADGRVGAWVYGDLDDIAIMPGSLVDT